MRGTWDGRDTCSIFFSVRSVQMLEPYHLMTVAYAVAALRARFGGENVTCEEGEVAVRIHRPGGELTLVILTVEQAKYLTAHLIGAKDLTNEKYPVGWPSPA